MEHIISTRITNVKKLTVYQQLMLEQRQKMERLDKWNKALDFTIRALMWFTALHLIHHIATKL